MLGEKRRFQETMWEEAASAANAAKRLAPSGSLASPEPYAGSRRLAHHFEYSIKSKAAFIELHQDWYPHKNKGPQLFKELLEKVQGVDRVKWQPAPLKVMGVRGARGGPELSRALILKITGARKIEIVAISNGSCWWNSE